MIKQSACTLECKCERARVTEMQDLADAAAKMELCHSPTVHSLNYPALSEDIRGYYCTSLSLPFSVAAPKTELLHHRTHWANPSRGQTAPECDSREGEWLICPVFWTNKLQDVLGASFMSASSSVARANSHLSILSSENICMALQYKSGSNHSVILYGCTTALVSFLGLSRHYVVWRKVKLIRDYSLGLWVIFPRFLTQSWHASRCA